MSKSDISILIVEDDITILDIITEFLVKIDDTYRLTKARNLQSAKKALLRGQCNLILLDVFLPDGTGIDLLKWLRKEELNVDVILLTADKRSATLETAKRYGAYDYILKPFKFERLEESMIQYMKKRNLLTGQEEFQQNAIDHFLNDRIHHNNWQNQTYEKIVDFLKVHPEECFTSSEIATHLGISRITARKYLESMELEGSVVLEMSYGNVGRPKNTYRYERK